MSILKIIRVVQLLGLFILLAAVNSCSRVFEEDITDEIVRITEPTDGQIFTVSEVTISWEEVDDAISYEIKVVTPDFSVDSPLVIVNTSITETSFTQLFEDGDYAVSVYAVNSSSETEATSVEFSISGSGLFTSQQVEVNAPAEGEFLGSGEVTFEWEELDEAEDYTLRVYENNGGNQGDLVFVQTTTENQLEYTLLEGEFFLEITAFDGTDITMLNTVAFGIDLTAPTFSALISPNQVNFLSTDEIAFVWTSGQDALSETTDSILIYSLNSGNLVFSKTVVTPFDLPADTLGADFYEWGILTTDKAGNWSESNYYEFIINE